MILPIISYNILIAPIFMMSNNQDSKNACITVSLHPLWKQGSYFSFNGILISLSVVRSSFAFWSHNKQPIYTVMFKHLIQYFKRNNGKIDMKSLLKTASETLMGGPVPVILLQHSGIHLYHHGQCFSSTPPKRHRIYPEHPEFSGWHYAHSSWQIQSGTHWNKTNTLVGHWY